MFAVELPRSATHSIKYSYCFPLKSHEKDSHTGPKLTGQLWTCGFLARSGCILDVAIECLGSVSWREKHSGLHFSTCIEDLNFGWSLGSAGSEEVVLLSDGPTTYTKEEFFCILVLGIFFTYAYIARHGISIISGFHSKSELKYFYPVPYR